jgi:hypothetical protein
VVNKKKKKTAVELALEMASAPVPLKTAPVDAETTLAASSLEISTDLAVGHNLDPMSPSGTGTTTPSKRKKAPKPKPETPAELARRKLQEVENAKQEAVIQRRQEVAALAEAERAHVALMWERAAQLKRDEDERTQPHPFFFQK